MIKRVLQIAAVATTLLFGVASPAFASYPPETLSLSLVSCELDHLVVTVDGALPNSALHIVIDFTDVPDVDVTVQTDSIGHFEGSYPVPPNSGPLITVTMSGLDFDSNTPGGVPFSRSFDVDRRTCPTLPNTGSDALPIGKLAFGATFAGALLVVIAIRRRPRDLDNVAS